MALADSAIGTSDAELVEETNTEGNGAAVTGAEASIEEIEKAKEEESGDEADMDKYKLDDVLALFIAFVTNIFSCYVKREIFIRCQFCDLLYLFGFRFLNVFTNIF